MAKKLDRSRGFGEVWGHDGGAAFVQDEVLFDADGNELVIAEPLVGYAGVEQVAEPKQRGRKKAVAEPVGVEDQLAANLQGEPGGAA